MVLYKPTISETLLDLVLTSAREIIKEVKIGSSLGCSDQALVKFVISRNMGLAETRVRMLNFRRATFRLFKELLGELP